MKKLLITALVGLFVLGISGTAGAVVLLPGQGDTPTTGAVVPAGVFVTSLVIPFDFGIDVPHMTGSVTETVYKNPTGYLFTYLLSRDNDSSDEVISRLTASKFKGFTVDADYDNTTTGDTAFNVDRHSASVVGFDFTNGVGDNETGKLLWIQTNAQYYGPGFVSLIDGRTIDLNALGPAVPEPATLSLLGAGILGLLGLRRRKA